MMLLRSIQATLAGALVGYALFWCFTPERFLPSGRPAVFVSDHCPYVKALMNDVATHAAVRSAIVVLPAASADPSSELGAEACRLAAEDLRSVAAWFYLVPARWICSRLGEYAAGLSIPGYPYWFLDGRPLTGPDERDAVLRDHGLKVSTSGRRYLVPYDSEDEAPTRAPAGRRGIVWRARAIGL